MAIFRSLAALVTAIGLSFTPTLAVAQIVDLIPNELLNRSRPSGDQIRFCINSASALADFDRAVAARLADMVLLDAKFHDLVYPARPYPLEYGLTLPETELFIQVTNNCDAVIGYPLPDDDVIFEWLTPTRPYYLSPFVLAFGVGAPDRLAELAPGTSIGSRMGIAADIYVRGFFRGAESPLRRRVYPTNSAIIRDLTSGTLPAAVIWEPAVALAAQANPAAVIRTADPPFAVPPLQLAIVMPENGQYLRQLLDQAIEGMRGNGELQRLLDEFGLPADRGADAAR